MIEVIETLAPYVAILAAAAYLRIGQAPAIVLTCAALATTANAQTPSDYACGVWAGYERDGEMSADYAVDYAIGYAAGHELHDPELAERYRLECLGRADRSSWRLVAIVESSGDAWLAWTLRDSDGRVLLQSYERGEHPSLERASRTLWDDVLNMRCAGDSMYSYEHGCVYAIE